MDVLWKENNVLYNVLCVLITENEKLFDRSDARLYWRTVYHMFLVLHHGYVVNCGAAIKMDSDLSEIKMLKKYRVAYLTGWNFSFQTTFLCLALLHDALQWLDKHESRLGKKIKYFRDVVFNGLVFPFTCFVTGMFWSVYLIDRELVFPEVYDQILPWWLNHCVHTNIFIVIAIETILTSRRHPTDAKIERILCGFVSVFYAVVYYSIFFFGGCWLYGVFGVMTWWQVCIYQAGIWFSTWFFYSMAFVINRIIHKEEDLVHETPKTIANIESKETTFGNVSMNAGKNGTNLDSKNAGENNDASLENGHKSKTLGDDVKSNGAIDQNGSNADNVKDNTDLPNGGTDNGKEWKSIGVEDENGGLNQPFDKSWSTKYRTNRTQFEKSSL